MSTPELLDLFLSGPRFTPLLASPQRAWHQQQWRSFVRELRDYPPPSAAVAAKFHEQWHVCHHFLRELVDDDENLLDVLWVWLPRFEGTGLTLFRGENLGRFEERRLGWAWTPQQETARMFASACNAIQFGGVLLRAEVNPSAIIAGPSKHSRWLDEEEFTVDPRKIGPVHVVERFPPAL